MAVSELAKALAAVARTKGNVTTAYHMARSRWGESAEVTTILRDAITTGTLGNDHAFAALIAAVPSQSIIAAIDAVSPFRRAAPNVPILVDTAPPAAAWRNEGQPISVTSADFETVRLQGDASIAGIVLFTREAADELGDVAIRQLGNDVGAAMNAAESSALLDPANDGGASAPASLTYNAITVPSSGADADAIRNDISSVLGRFGGDLARSVWACSAQTAVRLALLSDSLGSTDLNTTGGVLCGIPLVCARGAPGGVLALIDASGVVLFDGGAQFSASEQTTLQMPDGQTRLLWTENMGALRFVRVLDWQAGRPGCVAAVTGIEWNGA